MNKGKTFAPLLIMIMIASAFAGCVSNDTNDLSKIEGCTYEDADNYNSNATVDDGSCTWSDDEDEPPAAFSTEGDVECDVFTVPTEDSDSVIGTHDSNGNIELLVEPGLVTVVIDCIDMNGNTGFDVTTSALLSDLAGDPQYRNGTDADISESGTSGHSQGRGPDWCWVDADEWENWRIEVGNPLPGGPYEVDYYITGYTPPTPYPDIWVRVIPCPLSLMAQTNTNSGSSGHVTTIHTINAYSGHGNNFTLIVGWTSGSDDATGTIGITVVPVHNVAVCYNRCISGWAGKVNQHKFNGTWMTDPDGVSGWHNSTEYATGYFDRKVEYCQKWWPDTTSVQLRTYRETISFYGAGNLEPPAPPSTRDVYDCLVMEALDTDGDGLSDWDELNIYNTNATNPDTDGDGVSDGDEVNNGTNPLDPNCKSPTGWVDESASNREAEPDSCWRNTREREEYSVTTEREDDNWRTTRTFTRYAIGPGVYTIRVHTISVPMGTWYYLCPPHSPDFDDSQHWVTDGHLSIPPWGLEPSPPVHMIVVTTLSDPPGDYYGENEHLWSYEFSEDTGPNSYAAWGWVCRGGSIGEQ